MRHDSKEQSLSPVFNHHQRTMAPSLSGTFLTPMFGRRSSLECESVAQKKASVWIRSFVIFQFACQIALLFDYFNPSRVYVRAASFGASLILLVLMPRGRGRLHPAAHVSGWIMVILLLSLLHPTTNSLLAGSAQVVLYLAILGPLFWVSNMSLGIAELRKVLLIIFILNALSAGTGVLQACFPGHFQPSLSAMVADKDRGYVEDLKIQLANGERIFRPMGLTDVPGGASAAGFYTVLLGMGFYVTSRKVQRRLICAGLMMLGMVCLYLSQVRSLLILSILCVVAFCSLLAWQRQTIRLMSLGKALVITIAISFTFAVSIGGVGVTKRMATLIQDRPGQIYYSNRGIFLENTINELLPLYPLGAGLGRWGMMNTYFGDNSDPNRKSIYVEIQWTGWLLDGGLPLILAYAIALLITCSIAWTVSINRKIGDLSIWAAIVLAYSVGAIATTFGSAMFAGQNGMQFWLLNALLFATARTLIPDLGAFKSFHK